MWTGPDRAGVYVYVYDTTRLTSRHTTVNRPCLEQHPWWGGLSTSRTVVMSSRDRRAHCCCLEWKVGRGSERKDGAWSQGSIHHGWSDFAVQPQRTYLAKECISHLSEAKVSMKRILISFTHPEFKGRLRIGVVFFDCLLRIQPPFVERSGF